MSDIKVVLNRSGVRELLRSEEMRTLCAERAKHIAEACGSGYEVSTYRGKNRVNASVHAATSEAIRDNCQNNTLLKAVRQ